MDYFERNPAGKRGFTFDKTADIIVFGAGFENEGGCHEKDENYLYHGAEYR